jgi:hypothetical protein
MPMGVNRRLLGSRIMEEGCPHAYGGESIGTVAGTAAIGCCPHAYGGESLIEIVNIS